MSASGAAAPGRQNGPMRLSRVPVATASMRGVRHAKQRAALAAEQRLRAVRRPAGAEEAGRRLDRAALEPGAVVDEELVRDGIVLPP